VSPADKQKFAVAFVNTYGKKFPDNPYLRKLIGFLPHGTLTDNEIPITQMVLIPAGEFLMGDPEGIGDNVEHMQHKVYLDDFYIDKYEVALGQYKTFAKATGRELPKQPVWSTDLHPVVNVTWQDANDYCEWFGGRLPTEAEWEKAVRGGTTAKWSFGDDESKLGEYAWCQDNSGDKTHPVGQKKPNQYGVYDLHGNVWEWCSDWYVEDYYKNSLAKNPKGPSTGRNRVLRGGSWNNEVDDTRSGSRAGVKPVVHGFNLGFRCVE